MNASHTMNKRARRQRRVWEKVERLREGLRRASLRQDDHAILEYQSEIEACNARLQRLGLC